MVRGSTFWTASNPMMAILLSSFPPSSTSGTPSAVQSQLFFDYRVTCFSSSETGRPPSYSKGRCHMTSAFFRFFVGFCAVSVRPDSRTLVLARKRELWIADSVARFCTQSGQNSHLSLTLTPLGLSGVATAQSVRLYIVASGKRFAQTLRVFKPGYDEQARFRAIPENFGFHGELAF